MEAKISDDITFIPLEKGAQYWADAILACDVNEKKNNHALIRERGYDIGEVAEKVQNFYLEKYSKL